MQKKIIIFFLLTFSVFANDNAQATLGDIKEAVYKLIMLNKERTEIDTILKNSVLSQPKKDNIDVFIDSFVLKNKTKLEGISNGRI